ncbi:hypothetical protein [Nonomuraea sp. 10N515B]|uniref:hypothetical protein n=1 Tax=Nonomuraea sp. 10N515B TaxID=3457422 RepID=UPI003FCE2186
MAEKVTMADPGLRALLQATDQSVRQVVAQAAVLQDMQGRQLSVLRNTYPAWDITNERDASECLWWTAKLLRPLTAALVAAGVMSPIRRVDAIALASTLAWQSALLHSVRDLA